MNKKIRFGILMLFVLAVVIAIMPSDASAQNRKQRRLARSLAAQGDGLYRQRNYTGAILKYS